MPRLQFAGSKVPDDLKHCVAEPADIQNICAFNNLAVGIGDQIDTDHTSAGVAFF